jgi:regulator of replication initiation timing
VDPIEIVYDTLAAVPEAYRSLYTEKEGKAVLTHVNGLKTQSDVGAVQEALRKERENHAATQNLLKPFKGLDPLIAVDRYNRFEEIELAAKGKLDETQIEGIVNGRIKQKTGPLEAQLTELQTTSKTLLEENQTLKSQLNGIKVRDVVRTAATKSKVVSTAVMDIERAVRDDMEWDETGKLVTKADLSDGIAAGLDMDGYLRAQFKLRPHWWPESEGGGSKGGGGGNFGGPNPWAKESWNLSAQGVYVKEHGAEQAGRMAKAAGVALGATAPKA